MPGDERSWQLAHKAAAAKDIGISWRQDTRQDSHTRKSVKVDGGCEDNDNDYIMTKFDTQNELPNLYGSLD